MQKVKVDAGKAFNQAGKNIGKFFNDRQSSSVPPGWGENVYPIINPSITYRGFRKTTITVGALIASSARRGSRRLHAARGALEQAPVQVPVRRRTIMSAAGTGQAAATMQVPMLDLQAQYRPIRDAIVDVVTRVCDSQRFIMGPEVEGMERDMAAFLGVTHAVGVSSGTDALLVAMMALGVGPGDEVVTVANTFIATGEAIFLNGARVTVANLNDGDRFDIGGAAGC